MKRKMMTRFSAGSLALLLTFGERLQCAGSPGTSRTEYRAGNTDRKRDRPATPGKEGTSVADVEFFLTKVGEIQTVPIRCFRKYDNTKLI